MELDRDGLVRNIPNKGVFVREFSIRDIEDVFDLRIMMESFAILHTISRFSEADTPGPGWCWRWGVWEVPRCIPPFLSDDIPNLPYYYTMKQSGMV